jgi:Uma2 family endonuclease
MGSVNMVAFSKEKHYTPEEYLALEREAEFRSEYLDGKIFAVPDSGPEHHTIKVNVSATISFELKGKPYRVYATEMKVRAGLRGLYAYPDVCAVCDEPCATSRNITTRRAMF